MFASFVVPVFGTEAFLPRCLDSLLAQTEGDFEVIVVDDSSPSLESKLKNGATCSEIVARYDSRFRCVRQDRNRGLMQARLRGLAEARGDYVFSLDSDDYVQAGLLAAVRKEATSFPDVIAYNIVMDFDGRLEPHWCSHAGGRCSGREALDRIIARKMQWNLCGKAVRREVWRRTAEKMHIPPALYLNTSEDFYACLPILMESESVLLADYAGYCYYQNAESLSNSRPTLIRFLKSARQTIRAMLEIMGFAARERKGLWAQTLAVRLGVRILRWSLFEYRQARNKELSR